ncbi:uncharacterized protein LOC142357307 isoform X2 [Convolutriloba macropyga]|uniref:uncharacterized protein LOC142357307 isoform X2 n=1 Tax=Convolutriloba macropyga TaxID=536237 RepID=UPI003F51F9B1
MNKSRTKTFRIAVIYIAIISLFPLVHCDIVTWNRDADDRGGEEEEEEEQERREDGHYESLQFQIATDIDSDGLKCLQYSRYFCLLHWVTSERRVRMPQTFDRSEFWELANSSYDKFNWFSLTEIDESGGCCMYQTSVYVERGRMCGFSPGAYFMKVTDFTPINENSKRLNYIQALYNETLCLNVIVQLGFGIGQIQIEGANSSIPSFIIPRGRRDSVFLFYRHAIEHRLDFDWFKQNYICRDLPWICHF